MSEGRRLKNLRLSLGLSMRQMAQKIGVSLGSIEFFERDNVSKTNSSAKEKIMSFLKQQNDKSDDWLDEALGKAEDNNNLVSHSFVKGACYSIFDSGNGTKDTYESMNPTTGKGCIFIYIRKDGKHHIFREQRGGWTRTYTDVQLMGKHVQEV